MSIEDISKYGIGLGIALIYGYAIGLKNKRIEISTDVNKTVIDSFIWSSGKELYSEILNHPKFKGNAKKKTYWYQIPFLIVIAGLCLGITFSGMFTDEGDRETTASTISDKDVENVDDNIDIIAEEEIDEPIQVVGDGEIAEAETAEESKTSYDDENVSQSDNQVENNNHKYDFAASWTGVGSDRCHITVSAYREIDAYCLVEVYWGNSWDSSSCWQYVGEYDEENDCIDMVGTTFVTHSDESGNALMPTDVITNITGSLSIDEYGNLVWISSESEYEEYFAISGEPFESTGIFYANSSDGYINVRRGPGTEYSICGVLPSDTYIYMSDNSGEEWIPVCSGVFGLGYIHNSQGEAYYDYY